MLNARWILHSLKREQQTLNVVYCYNKDLIKIAARRAMILLRLSRFLWVMFWISVFNLYTYIYPDESQCMELVNYRFLLIGLLVHARWSWWVFRLFSFQNLAFNFSYICLIFSTYHIWLEIGHLMIWTNFNLTRNPLISIIIYTLYTKLTCIGRRSD